jgi:hypothetical protein
MEKEVPKSSWISHWIALVQHLQQGHQQQTLPLPRALRQLPLPMPLQPNNQPLPLLPEMHPLPHQPLRPVAISSSTATRKVYQSPESISISSNNLSLHNSGLFCL